MILLPETPCLMPAKPPLALIQGHAKPNLDSCRRIIHTPLPRESVVCSPARLDVHAGPGQGFFSYAPALLNNDIFDISA